MKVGSNIFPFGICNCGDGRKMCNPVIHEDWKQRGYNRAMICRAGSDGYACALKSNAISVCTVGGYIKVAEVNESAPGNTPEEEPAVVGSPDYMDELQDFLDDYQTTEGYKLAQGANLKFVSADGLFEGVYDKAGNLLTESNDPVNMGTYNYCDPANIIQHGLLDVWPYKTWGNVPGVLDPGKPSANTDKYNANEDAKKHYEDIKNQI